MKVFIPKVNKPVYRAAIVVQLPVDVSDVDIDVVLSTIYDCLSSESFDYIDEPFVDKFTDAVVCHGFFEGVCRTVETIQEFAKDLQKAIWRELGRYVPVRIEYITLSEVPVQSIESRIEDYEKEFEGTKDGTGVEQ